MQNSAYAPTPKSPAIALATLAEVTGKNDQTGPPITVHFNPVSLQLSASNELKNSNGNENKQYIAKVSEKLTMELIFDTTDTGDDVTLITGKVRAFVIPPVPAGKKPNLQKTPPMVLFEWGKFCFKGIAEDYKEIIDFFSASGVPLRAAVNLTLSRQDQTFNKPPQDNEKGNDVVEAPSKNSAAKTANNMQQPGAARAVATANNQESLRFGSGAPLSVDGSINLKAPVAFVSGSAGITMEGSAAFNVNANAGINVGGNFSAGGSVSAGIAGMARLSATEGAFGGLTVKSNFGSGSSMRLHPEKLLPEVSTESFAITSNSSFTVDGKVTGSGSAGLRADVGASARLNFD